MVYIAVWSGGYEVPQYEAFRTESEAMARALSWTEEIEEGVDTVDVLCIDLETLQISRIAAPDEDTNVK